MHKGAKVKLKDIEEMRDCNPLTYKKWTNASPARIFTIKEIENDRVWTVEYPDWFIYKHRFYPLNYKVKEVNLRGKGKLY